jgi:hypothetical protein
VPRPALTQVLLQFPAVQQELRISEAQKKEEAEIEERLYQKLQKARTEMQDRARFRATREAILTETRAAQLANLNPDQRERLSQIQLQAQGPLAFFREGEASSSIGDPERFNGPPVSEQLKLSAEQRKRIRTIAEEATVQIETAASFRLPRDSKDQPTAETLRKLVEGPEFRAAKEKARRSAREAWDAAIARIEAVLSGEQRASY